MALTLVTPPALDPVSIEDARLHCRIDSTDDDPALDLYIKAATAHLERQLGRAFITQTWRQQFRAFADVLRIDREPLISVESVSYFDSVNDPATLAATAYGNYVDALGPYVGLKHNQSWPSVYSRADAVTLTYTAGYGPEAKDVPAPIRLAILNAVLMKYQRGADPDLDRALQQQIDDDIRPFHRFSV